MPMVKKQRHHLSLFYANHPPLIIANLPTGIGQYAGRVNGCQFCFLCAHHPFQQGELDYKSELVIGQWHNKDVYSTANGYIGINMSE